MEPIKEFQGVNRFLSNFYPSPFTYKGVTFQTVEHFYQAFKATKKEDYLAIAACATPGQAKRKGRMIEIRSDWESIKVQVMGFALEEKFKNPVLRRQLLHTLSVELIEGNRWHDNFWGNCYCSNCAQIQGNNQLGKLLMRLREYLQ